MIVIAPESSIRMSNELLKIVYFYRGGGELVVNDLHTYSIGNGSTVIIPEGDCFQAYFNRSQEQPLCNHAYILVFRPLPKRTPSKGNNADLQIVRELNGHHHLEMRPASDIHFYLSSIKRELHEKGPWYRETIDRLNQLLLYQLHREVQQSRKPVLTKQTTRATVDLAREYIYRNFHKPITLNAIAYSVNRSQENLARQFKKQLGITVFQFVRKVRIEESIKLMTEFSDSLQVIARKTGYQSQAFFSRCFKAEIGVSPSDYRNSLHTHFTPGAKDHRVWKVGQRKSMQPNKEKPSMVDHSTTSSPK